MRLELQETSRLIKYYLDFLASEKAQRAANYQPSPWELLTPQEQRARALARVEQNEQIRIDNLFAFNSLKRQHKERRREILEKLKAKRLAKMSVTSSSSAAITPAAQTTAHSPISGPTTPTCTVPCPQPLDRGVANQLEERVNRLKLITIQKKLPPVSVARPTEETLVKNDLTAATTARASVPKTTSLTAAPGETAPEIAPEELASDAMDLDPQASTSLASTQKRRESPEVRVLSKEEKIHLLTREHILLWKRCEAARPLGATEELKALLCQAQESQKVLQKLIPRKELEEFVKGWNPWTIKKELYPNAPKRNDGKKRSSSSKEAKELYNNPAKWKKVMRGCNTLEAAYRHMD
ncbi:hypothetical protein PGT21_015568 [Puccinia graminis f. sp. tritici]|uniref:Uncharacterized protein n=1 Tax=Puccinia graminis f. sp. tritici TaxID=56615 RepID=A0A5B0PFQ2_PUCGR|nr:hypothetical protein PGTUg99_017412 [Puccinia graminis f. sp. tritici]KAA1099632.1 hypothetical protein PGT21_015568 [Puccinia graminis f. sp. tritici]